MKTFGSTVLRTLTFAVISAIVNVIALPGKVLAGVKDSVSPRGDDTLTSNCRNCDNCLKG